MNNKKKIKEKGWCKGWVDGWEDGWSQGRQKLASEIGEKLLRKNVPTDVVADSCGLFGSDVSEMQEALAASPQETAAEDTDDDFNPVENILDYVAKNARDRGRARGWAQAVVKTKLEEKKAAKKVKLKKKKEEKKATNATLEKAAKQLLARHLRAKFVAEMCRLPLRKVRNFKKDIKNHPDDSNEPLPSEILRRLGF